MCCPVWPPNSALPDPIICTLRRSQPYEVSAPLPLVAAAAKHSTRYYTRAATSYSAAAAAVGPELHFFIPFLLSTSTTKRTLRTALRGPTDRPLPSSTRTLNGKLTHMLSYSSSRGRANERKKAACACAPFYARCKPVGGSGVRHYILQRSSPSSEALSAFSCHPSCHTELLAFF